MWRSWPAGRIYTTWKRSWAFDGRPGRALPVPLLCRYMVPAMPARAALTRMSSWIQLSVTVRNDLVERVGEQLEAAGALAVTLQDAAAELLVEPEPGAAPLWQQVQVVALFDADCDSAAIIRGLHAQPALAGVPVQVGQLADCDWSGTWRDSFRPTRFGQRLWVCPVDAPAPDGAGVVLRLDPGNAFGTGTHATTAMCLEWLDAHPPLRGAVIDYGCGSGILAIAAVLLGAAQAYAVDIDPQALQATRANARLNGVEAALDIRLPADLPPQPLDLVMANILANPLQRLAGELVARLRPGGSIIMTGIIAGQEGAVMAAYADCIDFAPPLRRAEWIFLSGTKHSSGAACKAGR